MTRTERHSRRRYNHPRKGQIRTWIREPIRIGLTWFLEKRVGDQTYAIQFTATHEMAHREAWAAIARGLREARKQLAIATKEQQ